MTVAPRHPCPNCSNETTLLAGVVLSLEREDPSLWSVCFPCKIRRQRKVKEWAWAPFRVPTKKQYDRFLREPAR